MKKPPINNKEANKSAIQILPPTGPKNGREEAKNISNETPEGTNDGKFSQTNIRNDDPGHFSLRKSD